MIFKFVLCVMLLSRSVWGFNTSEKYLRWENPFGGKQKEGRLISFNSDSGDISVELDFIVPFISLPVKDSLAMAKGAVANINVGAILLSGAVIFSLAFLLPGLLTIFSKKMPTYSNNYQRREDSTIFKYLLGIDEVLLANDIDATTCMQRIVCWSVKNASKQVNTGHGKSMDKLLDGVASNDWLNYYIRGTAIDDAIKNGYNGINCSKAYGKCQITQQAIQKLSKNLINAVNGG